MFRSVLIANRAEIARRALDEGKEGLDAFLRKRKPRRREQMLGLTEKEVEVLRDSLPKYRQAVELGGDSLQTLDRIARLIDQKATSMLTYLAILLAGISVMYVGTSPSEGDWLTMAMIVVLFGSVFAAAFLFLSVTSMITPAPVLAKLKAEDVTEHILRAISRRDARFRLAYRLTVFSSGLFAVFIFVRLIAL